VVLRRTRDNKFFNHQSTNMKKYLLIILCIIRFANAQTVHISGSTGNEAKTDTVMIQVWDHFFSESKNDLIPHRSFEQQAITGTYDFTIDKISGPVYFSLYTGTFSHNRPKVILSHYLIEPGDSIHINRTADGKFVFSGKGSSKSNCRYGLDSLTEKLNKYFGAPRARNDEYKNKHYLNSQRMRFQELDSLLTVQLQFLDSYRPQISNKSLQLLQADLVGKNIELKCGNYDTEEKDIRDKNIADNEQRNITVLHAEYLQGVTNVQLLISDSIKSLSAVYPMALIKSAIVAEPERLAGPVNAQISEHYKGILKDRLLATYMIEYFNFIPGADSVLAQVLDNMQTAYYKEPLQSMQNRLSPGSPAYDFTLVDSHDKLRHLSEFKGKTVFLDFWFTGCMGCANFYKGVLSEVEEDHWNDSSVVFISICIDANKDTWLKSVESNVYARPNGINLSTGSLGQQHPVANQYSTTAYPATFLIDRNGRIVSHTQLMWDKKKFEAMLQEAAR